MARLDGQKALITGAASGFGRGIAEAFVREGAAVIIADLDISKAKAVANELRTTGGRAHAVHVDISDHGDNLDITYYFAQHGFAVENGSTIHVDRSASDTRTSEGSDAKIKFFVNDYTLLPN